jgi:high affinity Mn2+ porin
VSPLRFAPASARPAHLTLGRLGVALALAFLAGPARADDADASPETWAVHEQLTNVTQHHPGFNGPYAGQNSLTSARDTKETTDVTLYLGRRLWRGAELWVDPEVDQGFGFDGTVGVAGFPSGEAYKVGANAPYLRLPRLFVRQFVPLGGDDRPTASRANQLAGSATSDGLTLTVGKFSVVDVFDNNAHAHDPRADFMNWSLIDVGTFDYAADAWGFTYGASAELALGDWTCRLGGFQLSRVPNGKITSVDFGQYSIVAEAEHRHRLADRDGVVRLLGFVNRAPMGRYADAVATAAPGVAPDTALVRRRASKGGVSLDVEQDVADGIGVFARGGSNDGAKEAYEFTEIDRTVSVGASIDGKRWSREGDTFAIAGVRNRLSHAARDYFAASGTGILIGDGRLTYGDERIAETYYSAHLFAGATFTVDYQHVTNPAYNRDRGPVSIYSVRLHLEH